MITKKYYKLIRVSYADSDLFRITNISNQSGTLTVNNLYSWDANTMYMQYSLDGVNFTTYDFTNLPSITIPAGANCYFKGMIHGTNPSTISGMRRFRFAFSEDYTIGGNYLSLYDYANMDTITNLDMSRITFEDDTHLISALDMNFGNVTTISRGALSTMFRNCTSLTYAPDLSNITTLNDYALNNTFVNCIALTNGADISSVTSPLGSSSLVRCYTNCQSLTSVITPDVSTWANTSDWLYGVAATGTLYCPSQTVYDIIPSGNGGVPSGWTKVLM